MPLPKRFSFLGLMVCILLCNAKLSAQQPANDSSIRASAIAHAVQQYQAYISFAAPLYAGPQYNDYYLKIQEGHPFFLNTFFHYGSVVYDHMLYENIPIKYDLVQNRVVIQDASGVFRLIPEYDKISSFTILDHSFIKLIKDSSTPSLPKRGFYEVAYTNRHMSLLKKEIKEVVDDLGNSRGTLQRYILSHVNFYAQKGKTYFLLNNKNHVLSFFKDKKTELRQYIRRNNLDFSSDTENAIISVASYYETLIK